MCNNVERSDPMDDPFFVDFMCNDELCFFFRCRTLADRVLVVKYLMLGSFSKDRTLTAILRRRYAQKVAWQIQQLRHLSPHASVVRLGKSHPLFGPCSVTTEFHPEGNLFNWLADRTHITVWSMCKVIQHVCIGLEYLHRNRIFHGNLGFRDLLFKASNPESVAIVLDVSVRSLMDRLCSPYVYDMDRCPPELFESVCQIAKNWPPANGKTYRTGKEFCTVDKLLQPTSERDVWCLGVIAHRLLTGVAPFAQIAIADRAAYWERAQRTNLTHPMLSGLSPKICDLLEKLLHPNPLLRAVAEDGTKDAWFRDRRTENDDRNLMYILEQNFMKMELSIYADTMDAVNRLRDR